LKVVVTPEASLPTLPLPSPVTDVVMPLTVRLVPKPVPWSYACVVVYGSLPTPTVSEETLFSDV
jgi:hypothetical protein